MSTPLIALQQVRQPLLSRQMTEHPATVNARVLRSWQRCLAAGLQPISTPCPHILPPRALRQILANQQNFLSQAKPLLDYLFQQVQYSHSMVILADQHGVVLETRGEQQFSSKAKQVALCAGACWNEQQRGTNAIGTALIDQASIQIHGAEHFLDHHLFLTCAAAPIMDAQGSLLGVMDISGDAHHPHPHTLALVNLAATLLENRLLRAQTKHYACLQLHPQANGLDSPSEGLLLLDHDGYLRGANRIALGWLKRAWNDLGHIRLQDCLTTNGQTLLAHCTQTLHTADATSFFVRLNPAIKPSLKHQKTPPAEPRDAFSQLDSGDPHWRQAADKARRIVGKDIPLLLLGESGVGKELFARAVHAVSPQANGPFVAINCAALPEHLIEAELFGYVTGAFTGARREGNLGRLREASGGTLFLDEIGDMSLNLQTRLLRVLQERCVTPLGSGKSVAVDFALIAATHQALSKAVEQGQFRADLYYRLNGLTLKLPALRTRQDLPVLIERLLQQFSPTKPITLSHAVQCAFSYYPWPGNLRQLANVLRTAVAMLNDTEICIHWEHLPDDLNEALQTQNAGHTLAQRSQQTIQAVLAECHGNLSAAARQLGISRQTLYRKLATLPPHTPLKL